MAISTNSPEKSLSEQQTPTQQPAPNNPNPSNSDLPSTIPATVTVVTVNPNASLTNSQPTGIAPVPTPAPIHSIVPPSQVSTVYPSFRPATLPVPLPTAPQFSPVPNPSLQNHGIQGQIQVQVQPPGVMVSGAMPSVQQVMPMHYGQPGQQPMRMYAPLPNGYQMAVPQGTMNPPGLAIKESLSVNNSEKTLVKSICEELELV